ncbi:uncharacterized protein EDB91DRAFT_742719 [Suillus paluster]|uniref:uncharacterized protein n=1 Tax=Suillus paluster TaxID=48578 RepID=UPI001B87BAD6|nr:uncharacterized protein EDB91DRAFT_742719 [Suillus paluster]KAG1730830.1 hypothetical protein EDB91DRAFT_742719 [Suillus paluster]
MMETVYPSPMDDTRQPSDIDSTYHFSQPGSDCQSDCHSRSVPEYYSVEISNIEMTQLPKVGWLSLDDHFWLQITADGKVEETSVEGRGSLRWQHKFTFNMRKSSALSFQLYARRYVHENKFIGKVERCVDTLVTHPDDTVFRGWHNPEYTDSLEHTSLICRITKRNISPDEAAASAAKAQLCISKIIVHHLPRISVTKVQRGHSPQWEGEYRCEYRKDSRIQLKIFAHRRVHEDQFVGVISDEVESLLRRGCDRFRRLIRSEKSTHFLQAWSFKLHP